MEGVMMRGKSGIATAVRDQDGVIRLEADRLKPQSEVNKIAKLPVIRGAVNFFSSMVTGVKILMRSAEVYGEEEGGEPSKFEKWLSKTFKVDIMSVVITLGVVLGLAFSIGLFFVIPHFLGRLFSTYVTDKLIWVNLFEGLLRILIFVCYVLLTSLMKDIKRTYMYHGAEHKTIFCLEKERELTVENVKEQSRFHPRCGTSFMILMLIVGILINLLIVTLFPQVTNLNILWVAIKILMVPFICGLGYELIKICGKYDNFITRIIAAPGMWVQRLTTKEPEDDMIEVAIASIIAVLPDNEKISLDCCGKE